MSKQLLASAHSGFGRGSSSSSFGRKNHLGGPNGSVQSCDALRGRISGTKGLLRRCCYCCCILGIGCRMPKDVQFRQSRIPKLKPEIVQADLQGLGNGCLLDLRSFRSVCRWQRLDRQGAHQGVPRIAFEQPVRLQIIIGCGVLLGMLLRLLLVLKKSPRQKNVVRVFDISLDASSQKGCLRLLLTCKNQPMH